MRRIVLTFGLLAGGLLSALMALHMAYSDEIGFDRGMIVGYASMVLAFLFVYFGVRSYRDTVARGSIGFGRALAVGLLIVLVASACYIATWQVIYHNFMPDYLERHGAHALEKARAAGASVESLAAQARDMERIRKLYENPLVNIGFTFLEVFPVGLVMSLVTAGLLRGRKRAPEPKVAADSTRLAV